MNWFLRNLENCRSMLGMDSNYFYPMLISFLMAVLGTGINCFKGMKERRERKIFELYCESESDNFYIFVMFVEFMVILLSFLGVYLFYEMIVGISFLRGGRLWDEWKGIISAIASLGITMKLIQMNWIRKRLLGDKKGKRIVVCSILFINVGCMFGMLDGKIKYLCSICMVLYLLLEVMGLLHFQGRYIKYDFSSMKLYLNNGEIIICKDIEKTARNRDYISIETEDGNIILKYDKIWKVEYYGLPKVRLKNNPFS